jgi:hypothetical protein
MFAEWFEATHGCPLCCREAPPYPDQRLVAIDRNSWSQSSGARKEAIFPQCFDVNSPRLAWLSSPVCCTHAHVDDAEFTSGRSIVNMAGGTDDPLGARALYLGDTQYRIHGTNEPWKLGGGCLQAAFVCPTMTSSTCTTVPRSARRSLCSDDVYRFTAKIILIACPPNAVTPFDLPERSSFREMHLP